MRKIAKRVLVGLSILVFACGVRAAELERGVKAAFLYKFCSYVQWSETHFMTQSSPIYIGVGGDEEFASELEAMVEGRFLNGRAFRVKTVSSSDDLKSFHVLYFNAKALKKAKGISKRVDKLPILVVTDSDVVPSFSVINFIEKGQHVRFEISQTRAQEVGLQLSSDLLSVASRVL